jgi:hypothetical protein
MSLGAKGIIKYQAMKGDRENGGIAPRILKLHTRWR